MSVCLDLSEMSGISPEGQICEAHSGSRVYGTLGSPWERDPSELCWGASPGDLLAGCSGGYQPPPAPERQRCLCCCCCCCWRISSKLQPERGQVQPETLEPLCFGETRAHGERGGTMPAIKKERLDREEMALAAFNQPMETLPDYLAPLAAAAIPVVTPHPPAYDQIFAHRAYLGFHEPPHPPPHPPPPPPPPPEDLMLERFSSIPDFQPFFDNGEPCIEVECGENKALLYINKLCQGSKGPSIRYRGEWLTPNEFQFVSGRETAKDWKRSIRHKGKSLKTLMSKGILQNRGRLAEKRTIPLPPSRIPKKELSSVFSHSDSEESDRSNGQQPEVKQEEDLHISIMKRRIHTHWDLNISFRETSCSRDSDLSTIISSLHQSRQLGMPESQSRCELKRNPLDVGLAAADEILGKRRVCSPNSSSECPLESKKARSESPKENSHTPLLEEAVTQMTPEEHYRRMMSALNEHSTFEEQQQQRLYQLANSMAVPSHGDLLRARQEVAAAAARTPGAMEAHIPSASNSSSQRRKQGLPQHRDSHFPDREISHPPPLLSPQNAPHIALGPHLRPPFLGVPSALCQTPGYGFLQPAQAEMFARQQEMLRKQNLARLEMSAELIRQKELENLHRQRLLAADPLSLHPGLPPDPPALRSVHDVPEGHALRDELSRRNAMLVLRHNNAPLLSLTPGGPGAATPPKEQPRRAGGSRKASQPRVEPQGPGEARETAEPRSRDGAQDCNDEEMKDSESDAEVGDDKAEGLKAEGGSGAELKECKDGAGKACEVAKELGEVTAAPSVPCSSSSAESPSHLLGPGINKGEVKYLPPASLPAPQPLPFGFPYTMSPYFHAGTMGGLFLDGEESPALEDISKWTVEDVCSFVSNLSGCTEYTQVFREQAIDGETLPLLTEEHLLNNMGLKLGPALKIRSQVAKRLGRVLYMAGFPMALPLQPAGLRAPEQREVQGELRPASTGSVASPFGSALPASRGSPKQENGNPSLLNDTTKPQC